MTATPRLRVALTQRVDDLPERDERRDALDQQWAVRIERRGIRARADPEPPARPGRVSRRAGARAARPHGRQRPRAAPGAVAARARARRDRDRAARRGRRARPPGARCVPRAAADGRAQRREARTRRRPRARAARDHGRRRRRRGRCATAGSSTPSTAGASRRTGSALRSSPLALAPDGTVEAAHRPGLPHVGVMWHPEREPVDDADLDLVARPRRAHAPDASDRSRRG